jgi:hypothetical protein
VSQLYREGDLNTKRESDFEDGARGAGGACRPSFTRCPVISLYKQHKVSLPLSGSRQTSPCTETITQHGGKSCAKDVGEQNTQEKHRIR